MRMLRMALVLMLFPAAGTVWAGDVKGLVDKARTAYDAGNYILAIQTYQDLIQAGIDNAQIYYNLGNAHFKAGHLGWAIASFRRALMRAPQDEDIQFNLNYLRSFVQQPAERSGPLARWVKKMFMFFSGEELAWGALLFFWLATGLAIFSIIQNSITFWRWLAAGIGVVFILLAGWASGRMVYDRSQLWGVVVANRAEARNGPNREFQVGFVIPEGREVRILGHEGDWVAVGLPAEGYKGWVQRDELIEDK